MTADVKHTAAARMPPDGNVVVSDSVALLRRSTDVPLIIADPPYGIGYHSNHYVGRNPHAPIHGDWNFRPRPFFDAVAASLRTGGCLYLFLRWDVLDLWKPQIMAPLKAKNCIVWVKDNWSAGDLTGTFGNQWEAILQVTKGRHVLRGKRWPNVWPFARVPARRLLNPTQKPVDLVQRMIESSSDPGDLVVDPFCGSGTTGEAAHQTGRRFLLGDIDAREVQTARKRIGLPPLDLPDVEMETIPVTAAADDASYEQCPECGGHCVIRRELKGDG